MKILDQVKIIKKISELKKDPRFEKNCNRLPELMANSDFMASFLALSSDPNKGVEDLYSLVDRFSNLEKEEVLKDE